MLDNMKLGKKLVGAFLAVALVAVLIGLVGVLGIRSTSQQIVQLGEKSIVGVDGIGTLKEAQTAVITGERGLLNRRMFADPAVLQAQYKWIDRAWERADASAKWFDAQVLDPQEAEIWQKTKADWASWKQAHNEVRSLIEQKDELRRTGVPADDPRMAKLDDLSFAASLKARDSFLETDADLRKMIDFERKQASETTKSALAHARSSNLTMVVTMVIGALLAVVFGVVLSRNITRPLAKGVDFIRELSMGHLSTRLNMSRQDEVGELTRIMDQFADDLSGQVGMLKKIADGDLSQQLQPKDAQDEITPALNRTVESLRGLVAETGSLSRAGVAGQLGIRGDAKKFNGAYGDIIQGINDTLDAVVVPLRMAAEYVDRIAKGDIPPRITDSYQGEFNSLKNNLNTCIDALNGLIGEMAKMYAEQKAGDIEALVPAEKFAGAYHQMAQGVNESVLLHVNNILKILGILAAYADGDFTAVLERLPGKQVVANERMDLLRNNLRALVAEVGSLSKAAVAGELAKRADVNRFKGDWAGLVQGLNETLDALIAPIMRTTTHLENLSNGKVDDLITREYAGDYNKLKVAFNRCFGAVNRLIADAEMLAKGAVAGQLAIRADAGQHQGDFRRIIEGVNATLDAMINPVNEAAQVLEQMAARDLTVRMNGDYHGDHARIKEALNKAVENLDEGFSGVAAAAEQVSAASGQIAISSQTLAQGSSEQASSLEEISSSLQEMSSMTRANTDNAQKARVMAYNAVEAVNKGVDRMSRLSDAVEKIKESSGQTARIVKTIDEIAFQTNLLALNAAVEAARAGDAGRGFAVVAEEVRNLALRSAEAARTTAELIEGAVKNSEAGVVANSEVLSALSEINEHSTKVSEVMGEIAAASEQQNVGIGQVNIALEQMNAVTQQGAANSEESASVAEELSGQAQEMQGLVGSFVLSVQTQHAPGGRSRSAARKPAAALKVPRKAGAPDKAKQVIPFDEDDSQTLSSF